MDKKTLITNFLENPQKKIALMGMSGVGKTHLSKKLPRHQWYHYSIDYRIGTRYLNEAISDCYKKEAMKSPLLKRLLRNDSIRLKTNLTFDNLEPLSLYLGMVGDSKKDGLSLEAFLERLEEHKKAEIAASYDILSFIKRASEIYGYPHFIADLSGSFCELADETLVQTIAKTTLIIYLKANKTTEEKVIERAQSHPKPLYYQKSFLLERITTFCNEKNLGSEKEIDPKAFAIWVFPHLIAHRLTLYEAIAEQYGITLNAEKVFHLESEKDLLSLIEKTAY